MALHAIQMVLLDLSYGIRMHGTIYLGTVVYGSDMCAAFKGHRSAAYVHSNHPTMIHIDTVYVHKAMSQGSMNVEQVTFTMHSED